MTGAAGIVNEIKTILASREIVNIVQVCLLIIRFNQWAVRLALSL